MKQLLEDESPSPPGLLTRAQPHHMGLTVFLLAVNLLLACGWGLSVLKGPTEMTCHISTQTKRPDASPQSSPARIAEVPTLPKKAVQFHWNTAYSSSDETEAEELWAAINTAHGYIAVEHEWAAQNHWLPSMPVPGDERKGLYLLESYHQLHCLVSY